MSEGIPYLSMLSYLLKNWKENTHLESWQEFQPEKLHHLYLLVLFCQSKLNRDHFLTKHYPTLKTRYLLKTKKKSINFFFKFPLEFRLEKQPTSPYIKWKNYHYNISAVSYFIPTSKFFENLHRNSNRKCSWLVHKVEKI